ncbi:hypothetical protein [Caldivirga maquilingensis]|uniref:Uncharacterized protein n=1 Tax=Caldivirga maquilingensis (strain ATCC 700844 / DSM 13496 / JCM 10307 / IC-167) TaxID=397948 RepID=A8MAJ9_CALMQ|nr:hypothetical protein [Caldivirga maquilingensis]ABW02576.1 hypothetical protein Cmaq_1753 [Caldivirga maquilingensis IC-167]
MECIGELINALEGLLKLICNGVDANEALKIILTNIKNKQCSSMVNNAISKVLRGEVDALNEPLLNNYLLYFKPNADSKLKGVLTVILSMVNEGKINEALGYLMSSICNLPDYDRVYAIDLARLITLAKHDNDIINSVKCRIKLILS